MGARSKLSVEKLKTALLEGHGNIAHAARVLGVSRQIIYTWINDYPELAEARLEAEEELCDTAENYVAEYIKQGDAKMIRWYLERRRKERFSTRVETTGPNGGPIEEIAEIRNTFVDDGQDT